MNLTFIERTATLPADRWGKLPKWVRDHVVGLQREAIQWRDRALAEEAKVGPTNTSVRLSGMETRPLPIDATIRFVLPGWLDGPYIDVRADSKGQTDGTPCLYVMGMEQLRVIPRASNVVLIRFDR